MLQISLTDKLRQGADYCNRANNQPGLHCSVKLRDFGFVVELVQQLGDNTSWHHSKSLTFSQVEDAVIDNPISAAVDQLMEHAGRHAQARAA